MAAAFTALRVLLGLFFSLTGALKVSDWLSADLHRHMASEFVRFAKVFPLKELGFVPEPGRYLVAVGWVEVTAGLLLAFGPQLLQEISNFILSVVMIGESQWAPAARGGYWDTLGLRPPFPRSAPCPGAIYTLLALQEPLAMCAPATLSLGLLLLLNIRGYPAAPRPKFE
uniref:Transmembrane protein 35B n=1 Tax=Catharus ustulatus TaxID=91951 RepID=A0A8C3UFG2_CATUS